MGDLCDNVTMGRDDDSYDSNIDIPQTKPTKYLQQVHEHNKFPNANEQIDTAHESDPNDQSSF